MTEQQTPPVGETTTDESSSKWTIQRVTVLAAGALGGILMVIFLIGLALALFADVQPTAARIQVIRDIFVILIGLELILIVAALAVLVVQVARLITLLKSETKPILENAQEATRSAKNTVDFVSSNVTQPIVRVGSFMAGARVLLRDVGGIRRAIRRTTAKGEKNGAGKS